MDMSEDLQPCDPCKAGNHGKCENWPSCLCAMQGHRGKLKRPVQHGRHPEPRRKGRKKD